MKIAYVYDAFYTWIKSGAEKRIYEISKWLVGRGHEVHWFGIKWWDGMKKVHGWFAANWRDIKRSAEF